MTTRHHLDSLYYRHSGRFSPLGFPTALAASLLAAIALGAAYAYVDLYNPIVSYLTFLLTFGFAVAVGAVPAFTFRWGHVRNNTLTALAAALVAFVGLYASWIFWVYAVIQQGGPTEGITPWDLVVRPDLLADVILRINEIGAWSFGGHTGPSDSSTRVTGILAWLIWTSEAAMVLGASIATTLRLGSSRPYCETCGKWCPGPRELLTINPGDSVELREMLERRDFEGIRRLGLVPDASLNCFALMLHQCEQCGKLNALSAVHRTTTVPRKGDPKTKTRLLADKLLVSPEEVERIEAMKPSAYVPSAGSPGAQSRPAAPATVRTEAPASKVNPLNPTISDPSPSSRHSNPPPPSGSWL